MRERGWGRIINISSGGAWQPFADMADYTATKAAVKTVVDVTNPLSDDPPVNGVHSYLTSLEESLMERLQREFPDAHFVKAFNQVNNSRW
jgi:NAD(P)-dependent dehydrogenase (short-subunit alcohol dehydrogenase family)